MKLLYRRLKNNRKALNTGVFLGILTGVIGFIFMAFFNFMIEKLLSGSYDRVNFVYLIMILFLFLISLWSQRALSHKIIVLSQQIYWNLRHDLLKLILASNYEEVSKKKDEVHSTLVSDIGTITAASLGIISMITSSVVVLACLIYMLALSWKLFTVTFCVASLGVVVYAIGVKKGMKKYNMVRDIEDKFLSNFNSILFGFKEIFLNHKKGKSIYDGNIVPMSKKSFSNSVAASVTFLNSQIVTNMLLNVLVASILIYFSVNLDIEVLTVVQFLFILQYLQASIASVLMTLPSLGQAKISLERFEKLKNEWVQNDEVILDENDVLDLNSFDTIELKNIYFEHKSELNDKKFQIGPIDFTVNKGDIVFVYGGNGSGKTTFINTFTGIYAADQGGYYFNGEKINGVFHYRNLFSPVFSDFYLFEEFFGNEDFDAEKARYYLKMFELDLKVRVISKGFSSIDFSTGQRKRLALIAALLEKKPIIILDEWAADQDPHFRKKFYTEILPEIKKEGFTIVAITHDDSYYHCADKLFSMKYGKLHEEDANKLI